MNLNEIERELHFRMNNEGMVNVKDVMQLIYMSETAGIAYGYTPVPEFLGYVAPMLLESNHMTIMGNLNELINKEFKIRHQKRILVDAEDKPNATCYPMLAKDPNKVFNINKKKWR